jgi:transposase InsO family protein
VDVIGLRREFVALADRGEVSFSELCRRFAISRQVGYKWLGRYRVEGVEGLRDRSRRPHNIERRVPQRVERALVAIREQHPAWGARKIRRTLQDTGAEPVPACSTVTAILHRRNLVSPDGQGGRKDWHRFEHPVPNALWQMDFKGPIPTLAGEAHPLTMLDDHSRFCLCARALPNEQTPGVTKALAHTFRRYGLPDALLVDNGNPWGGDERQPYTRVTVWLIRLGVWVSHSRQYHPQTLGKDERFHGTLERELLSRHQWRDLAHLQAALDEYRDEYNFQRPHDALGLEVPGRRYTASLRSLPQTLPPIEYPRGVHVRKVQSPGEIWFQGRVFKMSSAFCGYPVGIRPTPIDGVFEVLFCHHVIQRLDLRNSERGR